MTKKHARSTSPVNNPAEAAELNAAKATCAVALVRAVGAARHVSNARAHIASLERLAAQAEALHAAVTRELASDRALVLDWRPEVAAALEDIVNEDAACRAANGGRSPLRELPTPAGFESVDAFLAELRRVAREG